MSALLVLLLMAGLGVDVGYLRYQRQQMQKAADAGAVAAGAALVYHGSYVSAARNDAAANGFTHGVGGVTVAVNSPPTSGAYSGNANYVEVIVSQPRPTFFMRVGGFTSVNVSARAVSSAANSGSGCIYALDPTDSSSFFMNGSSSLNSACGVLVNSNSGAALTKTGSGYIAITDGGVGVVGGVNNNGNSGSISPTPITGIAPFSDPLSWLAAPTVGSCDYNNTKITSSGSVTLTAGVYCGGITITGSGTVTFDASNGKPFILNGGGFTTNGSAKLIGSGVTFYNTGTTSGSAKTRYAPVHFGGSSGTSLTAPTSGPFAGILFFQDRTIQDYSGQNIWDGSNVDKYEGAIYSPTVPVTYTGTTGHAAYSIIVGWQIAIQGTADIRDDYSSLPGGASPIRIANIVE